MRSTLSTKQLLARHDHRKRELGDGNVISLAPDIRHDMVAVSGGALFLTTGSLTHCSALQEGCIGVVEVTSEEVVHPDVYPPFRYVLQK